MFCIFLTIYHYSSQFGQGKRPQARQCGYYYRGTIEALSRAIEGLSGGNSDIIRGLFGDVLGTIRGLSEDPSPEDLRIDPWCSPVFPLYFPDRRLGVLRQSPDRVKSPLSLRVAASKPNRCCVQQQWVHSHDKIRFDWAKFWCNIYRISRRSWIRARFAVTYKNSETFWEIVFFAW